MMASFVTSHAKVTIIQDNTPPNNHEEVKKDEYHQQLQYLVSHTPHHDITIVMGDMNVQIVEDRCGFEQVLDQHAYGNCRDNSNHFINFCTMNKYNIGSSILQHKDILKNIWISNDDKTHHIIERICGLCNHVWECRDVPLRLITWQ